jgi:hypothetical protein
MYFFDCQHAAAEDNPDHICLTAEDGCSTKYACRPDLTRQAPLVHYQHHHRADDIRVKEKEEEVLNWKENNDSNA